MNATAFRARLVAVCREALPLPGRGHTPERHKRLFATAQENVSLAKLAEAHWDAVAILAEAGREPEPGAVYAVWASEVPGQPLQVNGGSVSGTKAFCSGVGLVDRALVTVGSDDGRLLDVDLRTPGTVIPDLSAWQTEAFRATNTGGVRFCHLPLDPDAAVGEPDFYLNRPGFWHGACGPAACWGGGAAGLLTFAEASGRKDPHTVAHLAAMRANCWAMEALLEKAGGEIDAQPENLRAAQRRALTLRHLIEQLATDTLRRFGRAYGPYPLAMHPETSRRFAETEIFLRQCHAERDLEALAALGPFPDS